MVTTDYHWRGLPSAAGPQWRHYPEGRLDYSGPEHGPVEHIEVVTHLIIDGATVKTSRAFSMRCQECGARS